jgi:CHAT domain-containing protein
MAGLRRYDLHLIRPIPGPYAHPRYWAAFILIGDPE